VPRRFHLAETKGNNLAKINRECKIMANKACNEVVTVANMPMTFSVQTFGIRTVMYFATNKIRRTDYETEK